MRTVRILVTVGKVLEDPPFFVRPCAILCQHVNWIDLISSLSLSLSLLNIGPIPFPLLNFVTCPSISLVPARDRQFPSAHIGI